jgi:hypothetical protein
MSNVPNPFASFSIFKGDITKIDYLHLVQESDGSIPGWIDESGHPQGTLLTGGGSSNIFVQGALVTNPNFLPGTGINFNVSGSNVTINSTAAGGVTSLNSLVGALNITVGAGLSVTPSGTSINLANTGVTGLNTLVGGISLTSTSGTVSIVASGNTIDLEATGGSAGVASLNTLTGNLALIAGPGIGITLGSGEITLSSTGGVSSLNSLLGALNITAAGSVTVTPSGTNIQVEVPTLVAGANVTLTPGSGIITVASSGINAATGPSPWIDISAYGARTLQGVPQTTAATGTSGSPNVTLLNAKDFINGDGVVIYGGGPATSQSTPAAPTVTSPAVLGSSTYQYKCVGVDSLGGLTAASPVGTITTGPAVLGTLPVAISSISQSAGVVTVNFSSNINATAGQQISITGVFGAGVGFNGYFNIASAPTASSITYALAGSAGSGSVNASSAGRLTNTYNISAISQTGSIISVTTNAPHNFQIQNSAHPTIVIIEGISPVSFNGQFVLLTASGSSFTCACSANFSGSGTIATPKSAVACVYEYNTVVCPAISGTTAAYYVYGDYGTGTLRLIGKTLPGQKTFTDWGPWINGTFSAPSYVPTTPPASAGNQLFVSKIISGATTTSLVLANNLSNSVSGAVICHDNTVAVLAAAAMATADNGGTLFFPTQAGGASQYTFNYPLTLPSNISVMVGCALLCNETFSTTSFGVINTPLGGGPVTGGQFSTRPYMGVSGTGNPLMTLGPQTEISGLQFFCGGGNGTYGLCINSEYTWVHECQFTALNATSVAVPFIIMGGFSSNHISNINISAFGVIPDNDFTVGQIGVSPPTIPGLWLRGSDAPAGSGPAGVIMDGLNSLAGRGILLDTTFTDGATNNYLFNVQEDQAPTTPVVACYGQGNTNIIIYGADPDSSSRAVFGNWAQSAASVTLVDCITSGLSPLVTGNICPGLQVIHPPTIGQLAQITNTEAVISGSTNITNRTNPPLVWGQRLQGFPLNFAGPVPSPMFWQLSALTGMTAASSGSGTFTAGTWTFIVTGIGWNGGTFGVSTPSAPLVTSGSTGVALSWTAYTGPLQGYDVWGSNGGNYIRLNSSPILTNSITLSSQLSQGAFPALDGSGWPLIDSTQIGGPLFRLANGIYKNDITAPTLTANRTTTVADGAGSVVVSTSLTTTLNGSPYTVSLQGATASSHGWVQPTNASAALDVAAGNVYVSAASANTLTIVTSATAGETFNVFATVN